MSEQQAPGGPDRDALPTAVVRNGAVVASHLCVAEADFVAELGQLDDPLAAGQICQAALELGVQVRRISSASADSVQLSEQMRRLDETFRRVTVACSETILSSVHTATDGDSGLIATAIRREAASLSQVIASAFDERDKASGISKIQDAVNRSVKAIGDTSVQLVRDLLDAANPTSPMSFLRDGIRRDVVQPVTEMLSAVREIKEAVEVRFAVQSASEKGTQKGRRYEELAGACLEEYATVAGDVIENVGDTNGVLGSKSGDHVLTVAGSNGNLVRIVFESKDRKLSLRRTKEELSDAARNRQADIAIAVFSSQENAPSNTSLSRIDDGRYIVVLDKDRQDELALRVAYQSARADAVRLLQLRSSNEIDIEFVLARVAEARAQLELIGEVEKGLNQAQNGVTATRTAAHELRDKLRAILDRLDRSLTAERRGAA